MAIANCMAAQYDYDHFGDGQPFYTDALLQFFLTVALSLCALSAKEAKNSLVAGTFFLVPEFFLFFMAFAPSHAWQLIPEKDREILFFMILTIKAVGIFLVARGAYARYRQGSS